ncbi:MAG TPA: hypothetical protein VFV80_07160 [Geminicoccaceae bacterium]|nr:hypothetical protein [Geminicoccaceae bacterium]
MWHMHALRIILLAPFLVLAAASGEAAAPAPGDEAGLSDARIDQRIQFLEQRLDDSRTHGQIWFWSWLTINGGSMIGNGVVAATRGQHDDRVNHGTGAALGAIGVADLLLRPLEARYGADPVRGLPQATRAQKLAKLRAAEDQLRRNAERAEQRKQAVPYLGNAGLALAAGLLVGLWGETATGIQTGISTLVGGTLNLWTQPSRPAQDWQDYLAMTRSRAAGVDLDVVLATFEDGGKLDLRLRW